MIGVLMNSASEEKGKKLVVLICSQTNKTKKKIVKEKLASTFACELKAKFCKGND
jgi:hypothetical protein